MGCSQQKDLHAPAPQRTEPVYVPAADEQRGAFRALTRQDRAPEAFVAERAGGVLVEQWGRSFSELDADMQLLETDPKSEDPARRDLVVAAARLRRHLRFLTEQAIHAMDRKAVDPPDPGKWLETAQVLAVTTGRALQSPSTSMKGCVAALFLLEACDLCVAVATALVNEGLGHSDTQGRSLLTLQTQWRDRMRRIRRSLKQWRAPAADHDMLISSIIVAVESMKDKSALGRMFTGAVSIAQALLPPTPDAVGALSSLGEIAGAAVGLVSEQFNVAVAARMGSLRTLHTSLAVALEMHGASVDGGFVDKLFEIYQIVLGSSGVTWEMGCLWVRLLSCVVTGVGRTWGPDKVPPVVIDALVYGRVTFSGRQSRAVGCPDGFPSLRLLALAGEDDSLEEQMRTGAAPESTLGMALWAGERQRVLSGELELSVWLRQGLSALREALSNAACNASSAVRRMRTQVDAYAAAVAHLLSKAAGDAEDRIGAGWTELLHRAAAGQEVEVQKWVGSRLTSARLHLQGTADDAAAHHTAAPRAAAAWRQLASDAARATHIFVAGVTRPADTEVRELQRVVSVAQELFTPLGKVSETSEFYAYLKPMLASAADLVQEARRGSTRLTQGINLLTQTCENTRELAQLAIALTRPGAAGMQDSGDSRAEVRRRVNAVREQAKALLDGLDLFECIGSRRNTLCGEIEALSAAVLTVKPQERWKRVRLRVGRRPSADDGGIADTIPPVTELVGAVMSAALASVGRSVRQAEVEVLEPLRIGIIGSVRNGIVKPEADIEVALQRVEDSEVAGQRSWQQRKSSMERLESLERLQVLIGEGVSTVRDKVEERLDAMLSGVEEEDDDDEEGFGIVDARPLFSMLSAIHRRSEMRNKIEAWRAQQSALTALVVYHSELSRRMTSDVTAKDEDRFEWLEQQRRSVSALLTRARVMITDQRVRIALDSPQYADTLTAAMHEGWTDTKGELERLMKRHMAELRKVQDAVGEETDVVRQKYLLLRCKEDSSRLATVAKNCEEVGEMTGIVLGYLTQLGTDLKVVQSQNLKLLQSMTRVEESLQRVEFDVKRMAGLPVHQLLRREWLQWQHVSANKKKSIWIDPPVREVGQEGRFLGAAEVDSSDLDTSEDDTDSVGAEEEEEDQSRQRWRGALRHLTEIVDRSTGRIVLRTSQRAKGKSLESRFGILLEERRDGDRMKLRVKRVRGKSEAMRVGLGAFVQRATDIQEESFISRSSTATSPVTCLGSVVGWGGTVKAGASIGLEQQDTELESVNGRVVTTRAELEEVYGASKTRFVEVSFVGPSSTHATFLSAGAGAGKTYALDRLHDHLWARLGDQMSMAPQPTESRPWVVPLRAPLGAMRTPLGNFVGEALSRRGYLPAQAAEFRQLAREGKIRPVLIADGYDENVAVVGRNVYDSNDLEELSMYQEGDPAVPGPCFVVGGRQSAVSHEGYQKLFYPVVGTARETYRPEEHFTELRLVSFRVAVDEYVQQHVRFHPDGWNVEQWIREIDSVHGLREQLDTPLMVKMTLDVLSQLTGRGVSVVEFRQNVMTSFPEGINQKVWRAVRSLVELAFDPPQHADMAGIVQLAVRGALKPSGSVPTSPVLPQVPSGQRKRRVLTPSEVVANIHTVLRLVQQAPDKPPVLTADVCGKLERECFRERMISRFDIYLNFMDRFKQLHKERLDSHGDAQQLRADSASFSRDVDALATRLAAYMMSDSTVVVRQQPGRLFREKSDYDQFLDTTSNAYLESLLRCLPISRVGEECRWGHRSYLEFNCAKYICDVVARVTSRRSDDVESVRGPLLWWMTLRDSGVMRFLSERCRTDPHFAELALVASQACFRRRTEYTPAAASGTSAKAVACAFPMPTLASVMLTALATSGCLTPDSGVTLDNVALPHAEFDSAALGGLSFVNCDLRHTLFSRSRLEGVTLDGCWCAGASTGELPRLECKAAVSCIAVLSVPRAVSQSEQLLVCGLSSGDVQLHDPVRKRRLRVLRKCHDQEVASLAVYGDKTAGPILLTGSLDKSIRRWRLTDGSQMGGPITTSARVVALTTYVDPASGAVIVAAGGQYNTVRRWLASDGSPVGEPLTGHSGPIRALASYCRRSGAVVLVSGSADHSIRQWDVRTGESFPPTLTGHTDQIDALATYTDQQGSAVLVSGSRDKTIRRWTVGGLLVGEAIPAHTDDVTALCVCKDRLGGLVIVSGSADTTVRRWRVDDGALIGAPLAGHSGIVTGVATYTDAGGNTVLLSGAADDTVRRWRTDDNVAAARVGHTGSVRSLVTYIDRNGVSLVSSGSFDGSVRAWRAEDGTPVGEPFMHSGPVRVLTRFVDKTGATVLASGSGVAGDHTVVRWKPHGGPVGEPLRGHTDVVRALISFVDGRDVTVLASGSGDGTVRLWHAFSGQPIGQPIRTEKVGALASYVNKDGHVILVAGTAGRYGGQIHSWRAHTGEETGRLQAHEASIRALATFQDRADGATVIFSGAEDTDIRRWCTDGTERGPPLAGHTGFINCLVVCGSRSGAEELVSGSSDCTVRRWMPETGARIGGALDLGWSVVSLAASPGTPTVAAGLVSGSVALLRANKDGVLRTLTVCGEPLPFCAAELRIAGCGAGPVSFARAAPGMRVRMVPHGTREAAPAVCEVLGRRLTGVLVRWALPDEGGPPTTLSGREVARETEEPREWWEGDGMPTELGGDAVDFLGVLEQRSSSVVERRRAPRPPPPRVRAAAAAADLASVSLPGGAEFLSPRRSGDFAVGKKAMHKIRGVGVVLAVDQKTVRIRFHTGDTHTYRNVSLEKGTVQPLPRPDAAAVALLVICAVASRTAAAEPSGGLRRKQSQTEATPSTEPLPPADPPRRTVSVLRGPSPAVPSEPPSPPPGFPPDAAAARPTSPRSPRKPAEGKLQRTAGRRFLDPDRGAGKPASSPDSPGRRRYSSEVLN